MSGSAPQIDIDMLAAERDMLEQQLFLLQDSRRQLRAALSAILRCSGPGMHGSMASIASAAIERDNEEDGLPPGFIPNDVAREMLVALGRLVEMRHGSVPNEAARWADAQAVVAKALGSDVA